MSVLTVYPDAGVGNTTSDGQVYRDGENQTFADIRAGDGKNVSSTGTLGVMCYLVASSTNDQFSSNYRTLFSFDTSMLSANATISATTLSIYYHSKLNNIGEPALHITQAVMGDPANPVKEDYQATLYTSFGSIAYADWSAGYEVITLNQAGQDNVNKTGISEFAGMSDWDQSGSFGGSWVSGQNSGLIGYFADEAGTTKDPKLAITFTTTGSTFIFYPEAGTGGTTSDAIIGRTAVDEIFTTIRGGNGTVVSSTTANNTQAYLKASTTNNQFSHDYRGLFTFDTSGLSATVTITAATLSLYYSGKSNGLGDIDLHVTEATLGDPATPAVTDYQAVSYTSFGSIAYADWDAGYEVITLNQAGQDNIDKTGISEYATMTDWDVANSFGGVWSSGNVSYFTCYYADEAGTTKDPKLSVTFNEIAGVTFIPKVMFIN